MESKFSLQIYINHFQTQEINPFYSQIFSQTQQILFKIIQKIKIVARQAYKMNPTKEHSQQIICLEDKVIRLILQAEENLLIIQKLKSKMKKKKQIQNLNKVFSILKVDKILINKSRIQKILQLEISKFLGSQFNLILLLGWMESLENGNRVKKIHL